MSLSEKKFGLDLTEGSVQKVLLRFALPFLIAGIINALYGAVDLFVISFYSAPEVISGVSTGTQVLMLVYTFVMGIGTGGTVLVGRRIGEKNKEGCAKAAGTFMVLGVIMAVVLTTALVIALNPLLKLLNTPEHALPHARRYVLFALMGVPFNIGYNVLSAIARGFGNSTTSSIIGGAAALLSIVLDFIFVAGFGMAEEGVATATAIAQMMSFIIMGIWLLKRKFPFPFSKKNFRIDGASVKSIFKVGIPLWLQELLIHISFMIIIAIINEMGIIAGAAVGIVNKLFNLGAIVPAAMGSAIAAIAAQNIGAGKRPRALKALFWGIGYSLAFEIVLVAICQLMPIQIMTFFVDDPVAKQDVILAAAAHLRSFSLDLIIIAFVFCINAYLSSCGKSTVSMAHSLISTFTIRVPLSFLFARIATELIQGLLLIGFAAPLATVGSMCICVPYLLWLEKKERRPALGEAAG